jgi:kinetochore protein NDC80
MFSPHDTRGLARTQVKTSYASSDDPTVQNEALVPEFFGEEHNNTLAFEYYLDAYNVFLEGSDDFSQQDQYLEDRYGAQATGFVGR